LRLKLFACEILSRELCYVVARSINQVDLEFLPKGLHDLGAEGMFARLSSALAALDETSYEAVLLGYGLCSNGLVGLSTRSIPLVIPRAHDCITLFLGDKDRYLAYFQSRPGTYFQTSGWIERGQELKQPMPESVQHKLGLSQSFSELAARYGEDNTRFLYQHLGDLTRNYNTLAYIEMGVEPDDRFERHARRQAAERGWRFEKIAGNISLLEALVNGPWDEDRFLVVPPGRRVAASFDERIITFE